jgi:hypothetical protein
MAWGFHCKNDDNDLLVSSDVKSFHFIGKPSYGSVIQSFSGWSGSKVYRFTITHAETPLVFIKPADVNKFYAVLTHHKSGNNWTFDVIGSGTTVEPPTLFAFAPLTSGDTSTDSHGMTIYNNSGERTFDSRLLPLSISDVKSVRPPEAAPDGGVPTLYTDGTYNYYAYLYGNRWINKMMSWHNCSTSAWLNQFTSTSGSGYHNFNSNGTYNTYSYNSNTTSGSNDMFAAPSLAQSAHHIFGYHYHCDGCDDWYEANEHHTFKGLYGVFYRQAYRLKNAEVQAGWAIMQEWFFYYANRSSWSPLESDGCSAVGVWGTPFEQKTVNWGFNSIIVADSSAYV